MQEDTRIFLVDDDIVSLKIGKRILQSRYTVTPAASGKKLLEMLETLPADMILLDIDMPETGGFEVLRILKSSPSTCDIPVVLLADHNDDSDKQEGFSLGAAEYISKPFSKALLCNRIEHILLLERQKRSFRPLLKISEKFRLITKRLLRHCSAPFCCGLPI